MKLIVKQSNIQEQVSSELIDKLYQITSGGVLTNDSELQGSLITQVTYEDAVVYLRQHFPNLIITANTYYIRFADPEVVRVLTARGIIEEGGGLTVTQARNVDLGADWFLNNSLIETFNESSYFSGIIQNNCFQGCSGLTSINLTNVTTMGINAFRGCANLEKFNGDNSEIGVLRLPNLASWSNYQFDGCKKLEKVVSLGTVTSLPVRAFYNCSSLTEITLPQSCISLFQQCCADCTGLTTINISQIQNFGTNGGNQFNNCTNLEYFNGPESTRGELYLPNVTGILKGGAFKGCAKLLSITSLGSITTIESNAFENCGNLATINFPNTLTSVGENAFNNTAWYTNQSDGPVIINGCILYKYKGAAPSTYTIPNGITNIAPSAFESQSTLTSVTIPEGVTVIDNSTFMGCSNLTSITIPNSVTKIDTYALANTHIQNLYISKYINNLSDYSPITRAEYISVDPDNTIYDSRDNCNAVIETATGRMVVVSNNTTIPEGVAIIKDFLFEGSTKASFELPTTITRIKQRAFNKCNNLVSFTIKAITPPVLESFNFTNANADLVIYVPAQSVSAYQSASGWSTYASRIQAIPNS